MTGAPPLKSPCQKIRVTKCHSARKNENRDKYHKFRAREKGGGGGPIEERNGKGRYQSSRPEWKEALKDGTHLNFQTYEIRFRK